MKLEVRDSMSLVGRVFRVAAIERGCCQNELWCRASHRDDSFWLSFYDSKHEAVRDMNPMTAIPLGKVDLVAKCVAEFREMVGSIGLKTPKRHQV